MSRTHEILLDCSAQVGPQRSLYIPGPLLQRGRNEAANGWLQVVELNFRGFALKMTKNGDFEGFPKTRNFPVLSTVQFAVIFETIVSLSPRV